MSICVSHTGGRGPSTWDIFCLPGDIGRELDQGQSSCVLSQCRCPQRNLMGNIHLSLSSIKCLWVQPG